MFSHYRRLTPTREALPKPVILLKVFGHLEAERIVDEGESVVDLKKGMKLHLQKNVARRPHSSPSVAKATMSRFR